MRDRLSPPLAGSEVGMDGGLEEVAGCGESALRAAGECEKCAGVDWVRKEMETADLGDKRLDRRVCVVLEGLSKRPGASLPGTFRSWRETMATYRLLSNEKVSPEKLLGPHQEATRDRVRREEEVLVVADTTELDYTRPEEVVSGTGPLNSEHRVGFLMQTMVVFRPDRLPLGVWEIRPWGRDWTDGKRSVDRRGEPTENKESYRWVESYRQACQMAEECRETRVVFVADREADVYELYVEAERGERRRAEYIVRAKQDRRVEKKGGEGGQKGRKMWEEVSASRVMGTITVHVRRKKDRRKREAVLTVQAVRLSPTPPYRKEGKLPSVTVWAVLARELSPPEGEEGIEWMLLTSLEAGSFEEACGVVRRYVIRWEIEVYFHILKSGCRVEKRQLVGENMKSCLVLYGIVAWRLHLLTMLGRSDPEMSCEEVFGEEEWRCVYRIVTQRAIPEEPPRLQVIVRLVGRLGGYIGRKGDGEPGVKSLWIGLQRLNDFMIAWQVLRDADKEKCV